MSLSPEASVDRVELLLSHSFLPWDSELLVFAFVKTRTIPFLCFCLLFINTVLTLSCSPDFFCLLFSVVLWFVLVQLVASTSTACVFCQRDIQSVFLSVSDSFLPLFTVSLKTEVSFGISSISITDYNLPKCGYICKSWWHGLICLERLAGINLISSSYLLWTWGARYMSPFSMPVNFNCIIVRPIKYPVV